MPDEKALLAKQAAKIERVASTAATDQAKAEQPAKECKALPPFDMLDLPDAMNKMGFVVGPSFRGGGSMVESTN
ncbi:hypothetical protein [Massilia sp. Root335]|uniref:hypothetical protein n=1 Tax=Massilia sp. Root335 TaxID=1736517 RepID=UPI000A41910B|nr:hypothetical protein [Massilia sp. Root335]